MAADKSIPAEGRVHSRRGLIHIADAAGYSMAGFRRLLAETAARLELGAAALAGAAFLWHGASAVQWMVLAGLFVAVLAVEALNTAIEVLTDRISPEWSQAAKDAKDLGSLAVGLVLMLTGLHVVSVLTGFWPG